MSTTLDVIRIILIEDSIADAQLFQEALLEAGLPARVRAASDARRALTLLDEVARRPDTMPDLIVLDLDLAGDDGRDVLAAIKQHPVLRSIHTMLLSGADDMALRTGAAKVLPDEYVLKPETWLGWRGLGDSVRARFLTAASG
ncbi:MAG TPA: response regulator [Planctomycetota bacterium]|nr:response regulator [Planctomycetota bacterium]